MRRKARLAALEVIYQLDARGVDRTGPLDLEGLVGEALERHSGARSSEDFLRRLLAGVYEHWEQLGEVMAAKARSWRPTRMARVDRSILRMALYEILHTDTPPSVCINEAVEIAKRYGTEESGAFVNGILGAVADEMKLDGP